MQNYSSCCLIMILFSKKQIFLFISTIYNFMPVSIAFNLEILMQIKWSFAYLICLMFMCLNLWYFYSTNRFHCNKCKKQSDYFHISNQQNLPCLVYQESQWNIQLCCIHWTNALVSLGRPPGVHCSGATHTFYYRKVSSHSKYIIHISPVHLNLNLESLHLMLL